MVFKSNKGVALPLIMVIIAVALLLCGSALFVLDGVTRMVDSRTDLEDAFHIAEAGYNKYLWYLNDDSQFYRTGINVAGGLDPESYYLTTPNAAWNGYPKKYKPTEYKSGTTTIGYFQLEVEPPSTQNPVVTVTSTGWTVANPSDTKKIRVRIHKRLFTNYVSCSGDMLDSGGGKLYWGDGEQLRGPVFTNGTLRTIGKPVFHDDVGYAVGTEYINGGPPIFNKANQPQKIAKLVFPSTNASLKYWGESAYGGYKYSGRTCILINNSTLKIKNKTNGDTLENRPLPASGVIYVNGDVFVSGTLDGRLTILSEKNIYITGKDPTNFDYAAADTTGGIQYANPNIPDDRSDSFADPCDDILGLVANGAILINTSYWPSNDSSGFKTNNGKFAVRNIKVQAAVFGLSSNSYYGVHKYDACGDMGYIYFIGSQIGGRMGATYTGNVKGYKEDNSFDYRMLYDAPPHFLEPTNSGWEVKSWEHVTGP